MNKILIPLLGLLALGCGDPPQPVPGCTFRTVTLGDVPVDCAMRDAFTSIQYRLENLEESERLRSNPSP